MSIADLDGLAAKLPTLRKFLELVREIHSKLDAIETQDRRRQEQLAASEAFKKLGILP